MTFLPVAVRELRVASRRSAAYWFRSGMAFSALVTLLWIYWASATAFPAQLGMNIFTGLSVLSAVFVLASGPRSSSDCLSEEKREGTLGLLFLTDLKGYDIVMGKLAASSIHSVYGLLSVIPVLGIPLLMGGVSLILFWQVVLALVNGLFFSLAAGIFVSSFSRNDRSAAGGSFILVSLFAIGTVALPAAINELFELNLSSGEVLLFFTLSPICPLVTAFGAWFPGASRTYFWYSLVATHCLGWIFIGLACRIAPRSWQDKPGGVKAQSWRELFARWKFGSAEWRLATRRRLLDINAFQWLASRNRLRHFFLWSVLGFEGAAIAYIVFRIGNESVLIPASFFIVFTLNGTLKFWVASESCRQMIDERRQSSLELLLSTPMTVSEIMGGQRRAMHSLFVPPIACVLLVNFVLMLCSTAGADASDKAMCMGVFFCAMLALVADCWALVWVGMWLGLSAKNPKRASGGAASRILVLPSVLWFLVMISLHGGPPEAALIAWIVFGLAADGLFSALAYARLEQDFRRLAMQRYQAPKPGLMRLLFKGE